MMIEWRGIEFEVHVDRSGPTYFVLGIRKCGSSMLNRVARLLAKYNGYNFVNVAGRMFNETMTVGEWVRDESMERIIKDGNVYGGFRSFPHALRDNPRYVGGEKILLVRDPRDALVSEYFSNAYSHALPSADDSGGARRELLSERSAALSTSIDEYVIRRAPIMRRTFEEFAPVLNDPTTHIFRYEDIIFKKEILVLGIAEHFGWRCDPKKLEAILGWVDVKPAKENPRQFIRKVSPGDHKEKLQLDTIARIDTELHPVLVSFGYTQS
jgi:hypothetical protein